MLLRHVTTAQWGMELQHKENSIESEYGGRNADELDEELFQTGLLIQVDSSLHRRQVSWLINLGLHLNRNREEFIIDKLGVQQDLW